MAAEARAAPIFHGTFPERECTEHITFLVDVGCTEEFEGSYSIIPFHEWQTNEVFYDGQVSCDAGG